MHHRWLIDTAAHHLVCQALRRSKEEIADLENKPVLGT